MTGGRLRKYPGDGNTAGNKPDKGLLRQHQNDVAEPGPKPSGNKPASNFTAKNFKSVKP
jgi:hypothetical protein